MITAEPRPSVARDRILDVASELFYARGPHAVGVDLIVQASGVAKMTLYKHFPSKDALVEAFLLRRDQAWREWIKRSVERIAPGRNHRPLAVFDALEEWFNDPKFRGCAFIHATAELPDPEHPGRRASALHKRAVREYLEELCRDAGLEHPGDIANGLALLLDGAIVAALTEGTTEPAARARHAAAILVQAAKRHV